MFATLHTLRPTGTDCVTVYEFVCVCVYVFLLAIIVSSKTFLSLVYVIFSSPFLLSQVNTTNTNIATPLVLLGEIKKNLLKSLFA